MSLQFGGTALKISERAVAVMRVGRKRKSGHRKPSGDLSNERIEAEIARMTAIQMPHRKSVPVEHRYDPKAESHLGRMNLRGIITDLQFDAGREYAKIVSLYRSAIEAPRQGQSIAGVMEPKSSGFMDVDRAREIKRRYDGAFEALFDAGQPAAKTVARVAVHDTGILRNERDYLFRGLDALVRHFGLTSSRKSDCGGK